MITVPCLCNTGVKVFDSVVKFKTQLFGAVFSATNHLLGSLAAAFLPERGPDLSRFTSIVVFISIFGTIPTHLIQVNCTCGNKTLRHLFFIIIFHGTILVIIRTVRIAALDFLI